MRSHTHEGALLGLCSSLGGGKLARIELLLQQIADVETERDVSIEADVDGRPSPVALLARLKAIGPQIGTVLYHEGVCRSFANRRDVAAYAGLVPTPWRSGSIDREQGIGELGRVIGDTVPIAVEALQ
jgi:transposase